MSSDSVRVDVAASRVSIVDLVIGITLRGPLRPGHE
jgi:hypothetical protein